ncbi:hypothetical protein [Kitasatospora sp. KL5]|uniref:hypothetical protein n=1 Tax=Kitasatospora sp. KL5 TaxID=3425125 RepID=UPI003D6E0C34
MISQGVKSTEQCGACGGVLVRDSGQFVHGGRLWWGSEGRCRACGHGWCEEDTGGPTPEPLRRALLAKHGAARVRTAVPLTGRVGLLRALREHRGLSLAEARSAADELASNGLTGTLVETELLAAALRRHGVEAVVEPAEPVPGASSGGSSGQDSAGR